METKKLLPITQVVALNIVAALVTIALQRALEDHIQRVEIEAWGMFFAVLGVIYAIIVGFLLAELLSRFHRLRTHIRDELNAVEEIRDYLIYVDENGETKRRIVSSLHQYVRSIVDREWPMMLEGSEIDSDTSPEQYQLMEAVEGLRIHDQSDVIALDAIIRHIGDVTNYRTERLEMSRQHLSPALRFLVVFMSVVVILGFALMRVESAIIHGFIVSAVVTAIFVLWLVVKDLDNPYKGMWNITDEPFRRVDERLEQALAEGQASGS